ncbi:MAG: hypothetical protein AB1393_04625 [Candidatus Edwardsbacteria bacterium]
MIDLLKKMQKLAEEKKETSLLEELVKAGKKEEIITEEKTPAKEEELGIVHYGKPVAGLSAGSVTGEEERIAGGRRDFPGTNFATPQEPAGKPAPPSSFGLGIKEFQPEELVSPKEAIPSPLPPRPTGFVEFGPEELTTRAPGEAVHPVLPRNGVQEPLPKSESEKERYIKLVTVLLQSGMYPAAIEAIKEMEEKI